MILELPLEPPEPTDWEREDRIFWGRADMEYEEMIYERICLNE